MKNFVVYSGLRLLLWLAVWAILQFLTPVKGVLALVMALLISGAISIVVLDRQRDAMSEGVGAFFGRINDRIERSEAAEDYWEEPGDSAPGEQASGEQAVDEHEDPSHLQHGDEHRTDSAT